MPQKRPPAAMPPQQPVVRVRHTPFRTRLIMAVCGVLILMASLYFLNDKIFPSDITYKNVRQGDVPYAYRRERP